MNVTIKSRGIIASLIFVLPVGISEWTSNNAGLSVVPVCGNPQACDALGCYGPGFMMCASMPFDRREGSTCGQATMMCFKWGLP